MEIGVQFPSFLLLQKWPLACPDPPLHRSIHGINLGASREAKVGGEPRDPPVPLPLERYPHSPRLEFTDAAGSWIILQAGPARNQLECAHPKQKTANRAGTEEPSLGLLSQTRFPRILGLFQVGDAPSPSFCLELTPLMPPKAFMIPLGIGAGIFWDGSLQSLDLRE